MCPPRLRPPPPYATSDELRTLALSSLIADCPASPLHTLVLQPITHHCLMCIWCPYREPLPEAAKEGPWGVIGWARARGYLWGVDGAVRAAEEAPGACPCTEVVEGHCTACGADCTEPARSRPLTTCPCLKDTPELACRVAHAEGCPEASCRCGRPGAEGVHLPSCPAFPAMPPHHVDGMC